MRFLDAGGRANPYRIAYRDRCGLPSFATQKEKAFGMVLPCDWPRSWFSEIIREVKVVQLLWIKSLCFETVAVRRLAGATLATFGEPAQDLAVWAISVVRVRWWLKLENQFSLSQPSARRTLVILNNLNFVAVQPRGEFAPLNTAMCRKCTINLAGANVKNLAGCRVFVEVHHFSFVKVYLGRHSGTLGRIVGHDQFF